MSTQAVADASVARALATLPAFNDWSNQPLDDQASQLINTADAQTLMSIAAHALRRIAAETVDED